MYVCPMDDLLGAIHLQDPVNQEAGNSFLWMSRHPTVTESFSPFWITTDLMILWLLEQLTTRGIITQMGNSNAAKSGCSLEVQDQTTISVQQ